MRQEQLVKLRGLYISLGGLSADLENSVKLLNAYAEANCNHSFILKGIDVSKVFSPVSIKIGHEKWNGNSNNSEKRKID